MNKLRTSFRFISVATLILLLSTCKRSEIFRLAHDTAATRFFKIDTDDPLALSVNKSLQHQEKLSPFVNELIKWAGYPVWGKISKPNPGLNTSARIVGGAVSDDFILVPFSDDSAKFVKAILIIRTNGTDTSYNMVYHWQYQNYLNSPSTYWVAIDLAGLFLNQDYYTFGHNRFTIQDASLKIKLITNLPAYFPFHTVTGCSNCLMAQTNWELYWQHWWQDFLDANPPFLPLPPAPEGTGGPGGGIDPNPCRSIAPGNSNPCNGGTGSGWTPTDSVPCDAFIAILQNDTAFASHFKSLTANNVISHNYETGFFITNRQNQTYLDVAGNAGSPFIFFPVGLAMDGFLHCHYFGLNSIFSTDDIYLMAQIFLKGLAKDSVNLYFGVTSSYGQPYLIKVSNTAKFRTFAQKVVTMEENKNRFSITYNPTIATADASKNEKAFLKMIRDMGGDDGVALYRGNSDCNNWTKLSADGSGNVTEKDCF